MWGGGRVLKLGARWKLGDGASISFWTDSWVDDRPLSQRTIASLDPEVLGLSVADHWEPGRGWK